MLRLRPLLVLLMVAIWLPATLHCAIDQAELLESEPACCDEEQKEMSDNETCSEHCAVVELGLTKGSAENAAIAAPVIVALVDWLAPMNVAPPAIPEGVSRVANSPPELARTWQFLTRAALPPRAPSSLS